MAPVVNDGLALALKSVGVALGALLLVLGILDAATALPEGRSLARGIALAALGLVIVVPIVAVGMRDALRDAGGRAHARR